MKNEILLGIVPIFGIRWWLVQDTSLYGIGNFSTQLSDGRIYSGPRWRPGKPLKAACLNLVKSGSGSNGKLYSSRHKGLNAPQKNCQCGIYAVRSPIFRPVYATRKMWQSQISIVQGEVLLWGSIIEHRDGWRAQYGQVKAFHEDLSCISCDMLYQLSDLYQVPVLSPRETV